MKTIAIIITASLCTGNLISHWLWGTSIDAVIERSFFQAVAIFAHTAVLTRLAKLKN